MGQRGLLPKFSKCPKKVTFNMEIFKISAEYKIGLKDKIIMSNISKILTNLSKNEAVIAFYKKP